MDGRRDIATAILALAVGLAATSAKSEDAQPPATTERPTVGISSNPAATSDSTGTGWLGRQLGITKPGVELGGVWVGAGNYLMSGGVDPGADGNSQLVVNLRVDLAQTSGLKGSSFGVQFLQLNSAPTNDAAGTVLGYNSIDSSPPLDRSSLVQLWFRQSMFDERLIVRIGKSNPGADFANVVNPVQTTQPARDINTVSDLLFGPLYTPATLYGVFPGFYETSTGITTTWAPNETFSVAYGVYDGNQARGVATGLTGPEFNGYYFHIAQAGLNWVAGPEAKPGFFAVGGWRQTGELSTDSGITENGATGLYVYASQLIWFKDPEPINNAGISAFFQFGWNDTKTLIFDTYVGAGLTFRSLIPRRPQDSFGVGVAWGRLNPNIFENDGEFIAQAYYQAQVSGSIYTETALSYIPHPGAEPDLPAAWAVTQQLIVPF